MYFRMSGINPMSDLGHAKFADREVRIQGTFGKNLYMYDGKESVTIESLKEIITKAWEQCQHEGFNCLCDNHYESLDSETIYELLNPIDIVYSADGWDTAFLVSWFWQYVAEPNNIIAVTTSDGAIVFDEDLITRA